MPTYVILMKFTDQGIKTVKEAPQRIEAAVKGLERKHSRRSGFNPSSASLPDNG